MLMVLLQILFGGRHQYSIVFLENGQILVSILMFNAGAKVFWPNWKTSVGGDSDACRFALKAWGRFKFQMHQCSYLFHELQVV
jgi:hypothetical protein